MRNFIFISTCIVCLLPTQLFALSAEKEQIQSLAISSVGGPAAVAAIRGASGISLSGNLSMTGSAGSFDFCYRAPDSFFLRLSIGPLTVDRWYDGEHGWQRSSGGILTDFVGPEFDQFLLESRVMAMTYVRNDSRLTTSLGPDTVFDGKRVHELLFACCTDTIHLYLNPKNGRPVGKRGRIDNIVTVEKTKSFMVIDSVLLAEATSTNLIGTGMSSETFVTSFSFISMCEVWDGIPKQSSDIPGTVTEETVVPFIFVDGQLFVEVTLQGGKKGVMLLDSGASSNFLTQAVVDELHLKITGELPSRGVAGFEMVGLLRVDSLLVGSALQPPLTFGVTSLDMLTSRTIGRLPCIGMLGYDFLARQLISVDFAHSRLRLNRPIQDLSPTAYEIPFKLFLSLPIVSGAMNGKAGAFLVDLGNSGGILIHEPFARAHQMINPGSPQVSGFGGIGGSISGWPLRLSSFSLDSKEGGTEGSFHVDGVEAMITEFSYGLSGSVDVDGNIGSRFLQNYTVTFDYANSRLFLEPIQP